jgi:transposase
MHTGGAVMFYCGIDVAKRKHAVGILDESGRAHKPVFSVENTHAGMAFLVDELSRLEGEVAVALEATGHYWLSLLLFFLYTHNIYFMLLSLYEKN